ncbi:hypothetical protein FQR65_LT00837 [Abscondita terminalis]|nr:hypothetical protein FQR65_LT00837 [Abscondita terminalis]
MAFSITLIIVIRKKRSNQKPKALLGWGMMTIFTCLFDVVGVGIFADEYSRGTSLTVGDDITYMLLAFGILFSISARGYVLWCINLIFGIVFLKYVPYYKMTEASNYNNTTHSFGRDNETRTFEPSDGDWESRYRSPADHTNSYVSSAQGGYSKPNQYPTVPPKPNLNDRASGFGRPQPNSFGGNVPSQSAPSSFIYPKERTPNLPSPDYSPPNSPLKSAMRNKPGENPFNFPRNDIRKEQDNKKIGKWLQGWGVSTIFICLYDIVAVGIFADEYNYGTSLPLNIHVSFVILAYGLLFTIAARGYILWCINLMFAIIFIKYGRKYKQTGPTSDSINGNRNEYGKP